MALAIAICIAGFVAIYVQLQPYISDFVTQDPPEEEARVVAAPDPTEPPADDDEEAPAPTEEPSDDEDAAPDDEEAPPDDEEEDGPDPTEESEEFEPDLQSNSEFQINLRSQPTTNSDIIIVLTFAQPLEATGETAPADDPAADGDLWIEVRTENGEQGWMREIDSEPFQE